MSFYNAGSFTINRGSGVIHITNPNFMHYYFWEIPENYHKFALIDSPEIGRI